jgi:hypothetical protein
VFDHEMPGQRLKDYCESNGVFHIPGVDMYYPQMYGQWSLFLDGAGVTLENLPSCIAEADRQASGRKV